MTPNSIKKKLVAFGVGEEDKIYRRLASDLSDTFEDFSELKSVIESIVHLAPANDPKRFAELIKGLRKAQLNYTDCFCSLTFALDTLYKERPKYLRRRHQETYLSKELEHVAGKFGLPYSVQVEKEKSAVSEIANKNTFFEWIASHTIKPEGLAMDFAADLGDVHGIFCNYLYSIKTILALPDDARDEFFILVRAIRLELVFHYAQSHFKTMMVVVDETSYFNYKKPLD